jgi:hypothetical protein
VTGIDAHYPRSELCHGMGAVHCLPCSLRVILSRKENSKFRVKCRACRGLGKRVVPTEGDTTP